MAGLAGLTMGQHSAVGCIGRASADAHMHAAVKAGYPGSAPRGAQLPVQRLQLNSLVGAPTLSATEGFPPSNSHGGQPPQLQQQPAMSAKQKRHLAGAASRAGASAPAAPERHRTTVMLRDLPDGFTRAALLRLLDSQGFQGKYDFAYLPVDFDTLQGLKHAFVNLVTSEDADALRERLEGFSCWEVPSESACRVAWNDRQQGLMALVERYRNSPVMHENVPDEAKPVIVIGGRRAQFPPPTQKIKAPKILKGRGA